MSGPVWLDATALRLLHGELLARHSSVDYAPEKMLRPVLDEVQRESRGDLADHAAAYMFALTVARPFPQGNEAAVLLAGLLFLELNGCALRASQAEAAAVVSGLTAGVFTRAKLATWLRSHIGPQEPA